MDNTQLDLSHFPKILPPSQLDDKEEILKRRDALRAIRDVMANLAGSLEAYVSDLATFDSKTQLLNQREYELKEAEYAVIQKEKAVYALEEQAKQEKEYIDRANKKIREWEIKMMQEKNHLDEIKLAENDWEIKKTEVLKLEAIIEEKIKFSKSLEHQKKIDEKNFEEEKMRLEELHRARQQELDAKEALLSKTYHIDEERKTLLDTREKKIRAKEEQLQKMAQV